MFEEKIIKRIPGKPFANPKENQGYIEDISSKTRPELLELLERENKLLANKSFISKLPDKGERIRGFKQRLEECLAQRDEVEQTCNFLSGLSLTPHSGAADEIEWTGKYSGNQVSGGEVSVFDESDESDPLKILASQGNTGTYKKKYRSLQDDDFKKETVDLYSALNQESEVTTKRIEKDGNLQNLKTETLSKDAALEATKGDFSGDAYAKVLCHKVDDAPRVKKEPFRPYCTTKSGVHPGLHIPKHRGPHWEVTAATPPPPVHGAAKLLTLDESLHLQHNQAEKLKEIQAKHAAEKLAANSGVKIGPGLPVLERAEFRETHQQYDSGDSSDEANFENSDGEDEDEKRDTIVYTYTE